MNWLQGFFVLRKLSGWSTLDERAWRISVHQEPPVFEGTFILDDNDELEMLSEFNEVTDQLLIINNDLPGLESLEQLKSVGGNLGIHASNGLTNLIGLHVLTSAGGDLAIYNNAALTSLAGLHNIASAHGNMEIHANKVLN